MKRLAPLALLTLIACTPSQEQQIQSAIDEANYCETAEDCVYVGSKCPFGCYIYANTAEAERMQAMIDGYQESCVYSCIRSEGVECVNNTCKEITE